MKIIGSKIALMAALAMPLVSASFAQNPKAIYFDSQEIVVPDFPAEGFILDIGGGGEGVIGQLKHNQAISIDPYKDELVNAPSTNLKIVMDGRDLKFIDNSFNTAAIFYTLMYINGEDHEKVFREVYRVLKHGGRLLIWDVNLAVSKDASKEFGIYRFKFLLPGKEIVTGYGAKFPKAVDQNMQYYMDVAQKTGFKVITANNHDPSFYLELQTPPAVTVAMEKALHDGNAESAVALYARLKEEHKNDYYFGADVLMDLSGSLLSAGRISDSAAIYKLALKDYGIDEHKTNRYGYKLLAAGGFAEAINIFKINAEKFPRSANAFDSLAEAYMRSGQKDLAVQYYERSLELDPNNTNATEALKKLRP